MCPDGPTSSLLPGPPSLPTPSSVRSLENQVWIGELQGPQAGVLSSSRLSYCSVHSWGFICSHHPVTRALGFGLEPEPKSDPGVVTHPILVLCEKRTSLISRLGCRKSRFSNWPAEEKLLVAGLQQGQPFLTLPSPDLDGVVYQSSECTGQWLTYASPRELGK